MRWSHAWKVEGKPTRRPDYWIVADTRHEIPTRSEIAVPTG